MFENPNEYVYCPQNCPKCKFRKTLTPIKWDLANGREFVQESDSETWKVISLSKLNVIEEEKEQWLADHNFEVNVK